MKQNIIPYICRAAMALFAAMLFVACEKLDYDSKTNEEVPTDANVVLRFKQYDMEAFGAGTYKLVVMAHNCDGSATITSTEKVTFPNNKVTDTFYYYGDLVVTAEQQTYDLTLTRAVAMFRLVLTDESIPENVAKLKFYYVGGSSTFSPADGYGCVNSKQTELRTVPAGSADGITFEIYTLPHTEEDVLTKLTVTALDANDNTVKERVFENVPVIRNQMTRYTGSFFGEGGGGGSISSGSFHMTADPDWDSVNGYTF